MTCAETKNEATIPFGFMTSYVQFQEPPECPRGDLNPHVR